MGGLSGASTAHAAPSTRLYFLTTLSRIWFRRHASGMMMSSSSSLAVSPRRSASLSAAASSRCSFMNMHSYVPVDPRPYARELHRDPVLHRVKLHRGLALRQRDLVAFLQQKRVHQQIGGRRARLGRPQQLLDELLEVGIGDFGERGRGIVLGVSWRRDGDRKDLGDEFVCGLAFRVRRFLC